MSKMRKIAKSFIENLVSRNVMKLENLSTSELAKMLADEMADEMKYGKPSQDWFIKYTTKDLVAYLEKLTEGGLDEEKLEILFSIINILFQRFREYNHLTGDDNMKVKPELVDKVLFPKQKIPPVKPTDNFKIDSWSELDIEIRDVSHTTIHFHKMIMGKPSKDKRVTKTLKELGWGDATITIFKFLSMTKSVPYGNKNAIYRVNKSLRELFHMQDKGVCVTTKNGEISTKVHITYYDKNNSLVTNHNIHHDAPEDKTEEIPSNDDYENGLSSYDEENIGCQTGERPDEDTNELDFNY